MLHVVRYNANESIAFKTIEMWIRALNGHGTGIEWGLMGLSCHWPVFYLRQGPHLSLGGLGMQVCPLDNTFQLCMPLLLVLNSMGLFFSSKD